MEGKSVQVGGVGRGDGECRSDPLGLVRFSCHVDDGSVACCVSERRNRACRLTDYRGLSVTLHRLRTEDQEEQLEQSRVEAIRQANRQRKVMENLLERRTPSTRNLKGNGEGRSAVANEGVICLASTQSDDQVASEEESGGELIEISSDDSDDNFSRPALPHQRTEDRTPPQRADSSSLCSEASSAKGTLRVALTPSPSLARGRGGSANACRAAGEEARVAVAIATVASALSQHRELTPVRCRSNPSLQRIRIRQSRGPSPSEASALPPTRRNASPSFSASVLSAREAEIEREMQSESAPLAPPREMYSRETLSSPLLIGTSPTSVGCVSSGGFLGMRVLRRAQPFFLTLLVEAARECAEKALSEGVTNAEAVQRELDRRLGAAEGFACADALDGSCFWRWVSRLLDAFEERLRNAANVLAHAAEFESRQLLFRFLDRTLKDGVARALAAHTAAKESFEGYKADHALRNEGPVQDEVCQVAAAFLRFLANSSANVVWCLLQQRLMTCCSW